MREGAERARLALRDDRAQHRPEQLRARDRPAYIGFGDQSGSKQSDRQKTCLQRRRRRTAPTSSSRCRAERVLVEDGRAAGVEATWTDPRDGRAARGHRARAAASSSPAARSSRRRCCCARGSAARRSATTCACIPARRCSASTARTRRPGGARRRPGSSTSSPTVEDGYGFLIETRAVRARR